MVAGSEAFNGNPTNGVICGVPQRRRIQLLTFRVRSDMLIPLFSLRAEKLKLGHYLRMGGVDFCTETLYRESGRQFGTRSWMER